MNMLRNREDCLLRVGIICNGQCEKVTSFISCIQCSSVDVLIYDHSISTSDVSPSVTLEDIEGCDLVFYCLSTTIDYHSCYDTTMLSHLISLIKNPYRIIYASVPIGFSESMGCCVMPDCKTPYWIMGLYSSDNAEECKKRVTMLVTTCFKDTVSFVQSSTIHWCTTQEAEFLTMAKKSMAAAKRGMSRELNDVAIAKGIQYEHITSMMQWDKDESHQDESYEDMYQLYSQFQGAGVDSYYFQAGLWRREIINQKDIPPCATDKKISLVIASKNDKMTDDVCRNLLRKDNIVILFSNTPLLLLDTDGNVLPNVLSKTGSFRHKQFFPTLDYIWDFSKMDVDDATSYTARSTALIETMNKLELVKKHNCSLTFLSDHDETDELIDAFMKEYPEHRDRVEVIHILFDKSERSNYVFLA